MGQKVNPIGMRVGINKDWLSRWYADPKDVPKMLSEDLKIRGYLEKRLKNASVSNIEIERNDRHMEIIIYTAKPGMVIGQGGEELKKLNKELEKFTKEKTKISIVDIKNPNLDASIVAQDIARQIENRVSFRSAQKRAIKNAMRSGALGIKTLVSGRLNGADMARNEGYSEGILSLHTLRANIDYANVEADTDYGKIGVKVWIYKGEILDDDKKNTKELNTKNGGGENVDASKNQV